MPQVEAEIMLVNLPQPAPSTSASHQPLWHTKLPSFLRVESNAFDEGSFDPEREEQLGPVSVESVLRWRWAEDASVKQSNSRILQWSDGSKSLQVGSELFDVVTQPAPTSTGSTYLAASHDYATLQEIQARVSGHMTFVPSAVGSQTHKKLASGVTQRHVKTARTQSIAIAKDPMAQLAEDQAAEAARLRAQKKKSRKSGLGGGAGGSDSEGDATLWGRGRGPARYAYDSDEDDGGFVVDDDGEEGGDDALDMAEKAFNRRKEIDFDDDDDEDDEEMGDTGDGAATGSSGPAKIEKKRMVVEGSDEE